PRRPQVPLQGGDRGGIRDCRKGPGESAWHQCDGHQSRSDPRCRDVFSRGSDADGEPVKVLPPPGPQRNRQLAMLAIVLPVLAYFLYGAFTSSLIPTPPAVPPTGQASQGVQLPGAQPRDPGGRPGAKPAATNGGFLPEPV